jgi:hypothetical protein
MMWECGSPFRRKGASDLNHQDNAQDLATSAAGFDRDIASATGASACWQALERLAAAATGFKLFTVMTVDVAADLGRRAYSSDPTAYPVSGTKPILHDRWFNVVHGEHRTFVANTLADIATVFPDHARIGALGCGSVVNLPVVLAGELAATINMLHAEHYYTPQRVKAIERELSLPAKLALLAARSLP